MNTSEMLDFIILNGGAPQIYGPDPISQDPMAREHYLVDSRIQSLYTHLDLCSYGNNIDEAIEGCYNKVKDYLK
jgi:hypothetical protein